MNSVNLQDTKLVYRNLLSFYMLMTNYQKKIKKIPSTIAPERIKCLELNLTKEVKHLYLENYEMLLKEIEDNTNGYTYSWIGRISIVNMTILPKTDSVHSLSKYQRRFSRNLNK